MTVTSEHLKPCPFCAAEPLIQEIEPHSHNMQFGDWRMPDYPGSFTIECPTEGCCGMIADTMEQVVANWNRRAHDTETIANLKADIAERGKE